MDCKFIFYYSIYNFAKQDILWKIFALYMIEIYLINDIIFLEYSYTRRK